MTAGGISTGAGGGYTNGCPNTPKGGKRRKNSNSGSRRLSRGSLIVGGPARSGCTRCPARAVPAKNSSRAGARRASQVIMTCLPRNVFSRQRYAFQGRPSSAGGRERAGSVRKTSGVPGLGVRKGLADEGRPGPDADHADLYPRAHRGAGVGLLCDTDGRAAVSDANRRERKARARDSSAQFLALLERRRVDEDVPRSLVARVGVIDDHLYLVAGHVHYPEVSNFVTKGGQGFVWQPGD